MSSAMTNLLLFALSLYGALVTGLLIAALGHLDRTTRKVWRLRDEADNAGGGE